jgi:hypothetical protein
MKIKDLPSSIPLEGVKVKTPKGVVGYWKSQWGYAEGKAGVWLSSGIDNRVYPQFVDNLKDTLEWEVVEEEVNCHLKTDIDDTDNCKE